MDLLERLITIFAGNGYAAVFLALLLCGIGVPLPEDITLIAGGVISGLGHGNVHAMVGVTLLGVLAGDSTMFLLGHHYGARILKWPLVARLLTPQRYAKVQEKFERYGNRVLFLARFLPGMRMTIYITAGSTHRVSFLRFFLLDGAAALISVPIWVYLGFLGAHNRNWLSLWIQRGQTSLWVISAALLIGAAWLYGRHRRRRRSRR